MQQHRLPPEQFKVIIVAQLLADRYGALADTAQMLALMAAVAPDRPEITAAQARNLMFAKNYADARALLAGAEQAHPRNSVIKAMLAMCMYIQQDGLWESYAEEALAQPDNAIARGIVEAIAKVSGRNIAGLEPKAAAQDAAPYAFMGLAC
jgi:thioredoxin-like negative regulator of GroEL